MEPNLFKYIWRHSRAEQLWLLLLVLASLPFYFVALDLPKTIVNNGISGQGFQGVGSTQPFLHINMPFGETLFSEPVVLFDGFQLEQPAYLFALCFAFLLMVVVNGSFKRFINTLKGRMGERMLRRLRFDLTDRILRFPLLQLRKLKPAEAANMINAEVEPLGGFIGDAIVQPVLVSGQAITAMFFIMLQSVWLGSVTFSIVMFQAFIIPKLRVPILRLGRRRQLTARQFSGRIGEIVDGAVEIHSNDTSNFERSDIASRLGNIFLIRFDIYQRKFFVKFLNNLLAQITPFLFYSIGGYLAIKGRLDLGALFAVIAAYKDLPGPIKELIDWEQQRNDVQIKYEQVVEQFQPGGMLDPAVQAVGKKNGEPLQGDIVVSHLGLEDDSGTQLLQGVNFTVPADAHTAVVGVGGSGKEALSLILAGLLRPTAGSVSIGGQDLASLPQSVTGRRIGYVSSSAYLFPVSVYDNIVYGLCHYPREDLEEDEERRRIRSEARRSGNSVLDRDADWIDYEAVGVAEARELLGKLFDTLQKVDIAEDVYGFGLRGTVDPKARPDLAEGILRARTALRDKLEEPDLAGLVESFDFEKYNRNATLAENILFGTPVGADFEIEALADNAYMREVLRDAGLEDKLLETGVSIAGTMIELFADLPPGHPFFEQFSFIDADDLPDFQSLVQRAQNVGAKNLDPAEQRRLFQLPFRYIEARHRLDLIDEDMEARLLDARRRFVENFPEQYAGSVDFYDREAYNASASLQDNILFGRIMHGQARAEERIGAVMTEVLQSLGLRDAVLEVGLGYNVGLGGKRLTATQRQKLAMARALLKQPDLLIVDEATAAMDGRSQALVLNNVLELRADRGLIWFLHRARDAEQFQKVLVMKEGRVVEQGTFSDLSEKDSTLKAVLATD
jgi:putative ABC transport system ATP-binding protein